MAHLELNSREVAVVGLQRTGTNYISALLSHSGYTCVVPFWKHSLPSECRSTGDLVSEFVRQNNNTLFVVVTRHPVLWYESVINHNAADIVETRSTIVNTDDKLVGLATLYSLFYMQWFDLSNNCDNIIILSYEDCLRGKFAPIVSSSKLATLEITKLDFEKVSESPSYSESDRARNSGFTTTMDPAVAAAVMATVNRGLIAAIGYSLEQVTYFAATGKSVRAMFYDKRKKGLIKATNETSLTEVNLLLAEYGNDPFCLLLRHQMRPDGGSSDLIDAVESYKRRVADGRIGTLEALATPTDLLQIGEIEVAAEIRAFLVKQFPGELFLSVLNTWVELAKARKSRDEGRVDASLLILESARREANSAFEKSLQGTEYELTRRLLRRNKAEIEVEMFYSVELKNSEAAILIGVCAPNFDETFNWAHHTQADALLRSGEFEKAEIACRRAIALDSDEYAHLLLLARIHFRAGRYAEATVELEGIVCKRPDSSAYLLLSRVKDSNGDIASALQFAKEAMRLSPNDAKFSEWLSDLEARLSGTIAGTTKS